ncbi:hypothetical protein AB0F17_51015, partial [Nonomuraea sp. NPDC026600]|uniref:hypothetical protein n=1 Tax=Nonomuraea sp. NPDC026600 TaxID=3155363 RepID=UPI0033D0B7D4
AFGDSSRKARNATSDVQEIPIVPNYFAEITSLGKGLAIGETHASAPATRGYAEFSTCLDTCPRKIAILAVSSLTVAGLIALHHHADGPFLELA